ncbi:MAG: putative Ig domain-containing protein, partial [Cyanobacteria bacterium J06573_2]
MSDYNNTVNSSNSSSDYSLLTQKNGWLNSEKESILCGCVVCQGTAINSIYHHGGGIPYINSSEINSADDIDEIPPADYSETFKLHSNPNAKHTIYLDFDGHITEDTSWKGGARINSPKYDTDGDVNSFSDGELETIQKIWQRVAEDFAPFDVNITTEEPDIEDLRKVGSDDERWGLRVVVTQDKDTQIAPGTGGVAYVGSFNRSTDTPAFSFNKGENNAAMTISHEIGHALYLSHDGISPNTAYHPGFGSGDTGWGPIMGAPFGKNVTQWSQGDYYNADNTGSTANYDRGEDDLEIITTKNGFAYRVDDYGNTNATAFELTPTNTNTVSAFGIIERNTDIDVFSFVTGTGNVSLRIDPSSQVYISDGNGNYTLEYLDSRGPNLDILAQLYSADGTLIADSNPADSLFASFNDLFLNAGEYYIHIDGTGTGNPFAANPTGYTDYGSLGQYEINGTIIAPPNDIVGITATDASKNEGDSGNTTFTFTVTRSGDTTGETTVDWEVIAGTNNSADVNDFVGSVFPKGTVTFADGETSRQITVEISGDEDTELDENFVVKLSNLSRGTLAPDAAIGTIKSDDAQISGMKWYDANQNGVKDADEVGLANWTIFIDENQNGLLDNGETSTQTAADGSYTFINVTPGTHSILELVQPEWTPTFPNQLQGQETYQIDDGARNNRVAWTTGDTIIFNSFEAQAGLETINYISVNLAAVNPKAVFLYQDADGDSRPDGNEKLIEIATNFTETSGFGQIAINPTTVSGTFFIGALYEGNGTSNTWVPHDTDNPQGKSWVDTTNAGVFNPDNLSVFGAGNRNFLLRAHSGAIPQQVTLKGGETLTDINFGNYRENTAPVGNDDAVATNEDTSISGNVLTNDTDLQNDSLEVIEVNGSAIDIGNQTTLASSALLTLNADGTFSYDPNNQFESLGAGSTTTDSFIYKVSDGNNGTDTGTVIITINGVNDTPVVDNSITNQTASENVAFSFTIPANTFSDIDAGDNLNYSATLEDGSALPSWLNFNSTTLEFSG